MYRVLIVDDEEMIVDGLRFLIQKGLPECEVVGVAYDGVEGFEAALRLQPDIIVTDVKMYEMSGIEMIQRLIETDFQARYIILSGYAEFEYAKQALLLGVENYITKPVEEEELYRTIQKIAGDLEEERKKSQNIEILQEKVGAFSKSAEELQIWNAVRGTENQEKNISHFLRNKSFLCCIFECDSKDMYLLKENIQEKCQSFFAEQYSARTLVDYPKGQTILVLGAERQGDLRKLETSIGRMRLELQEKLGIELCCGIGVWHKKEPGIRLSFDEAQSAINYKMIQGRNCIVTYDEIQNITPNFSFSWMDEKDIERLENSISAMDNMECRKIIESIFRKIPRDHSVTPEVLKAFSLNLILLGIRKIPAMQPKLNEYLGKNILSKENLDKFQSIEQLKNWIINVLAAMNEAMIQKDVPDKRDVIREAQDYIRHHYAENITLQEMSDRFFVNPYYFSQLFKKRAGETYQSYLTGVRIDRAKKLLEQTDLKIYEICELVGYTDVKYFGQVFEKRTGLKPTSFRRNVSQDTLTDGDKQE